MAGVDEEAAGAAGAAGGGVEAGRAEATPPPKLSVYDLNPAPPVLGGAFLGRLSKYDRIPAPDTLLPAPLRADKYPLLVAAAVTGALPDPLVKKKSGVPAGSSLAPLVKKNGGSAAGAGAADRIAGAARFRDSK